MEKITVHVVFGIYSGVISDVHLYLNPASARSRYSRLRKRYGFAPGEREHQEHEVKWFEVPFELPGGGGAR